MNTDIKELLLNASPASLSEYKSIAEYKLKDHKTSLFRVMIDSTFSPSYRRTLEINIRLIEEVLAFIEIVERNR
jgi:hypothetical protein